MRVARELHRLNLHSMRLPERDGLPYDWTFEGRLVQAKVARQVKIGGQQGERSCAWSAEHAVVGKGGKKQTYIYGSYDILWVIFGDSDYFAVVPKSVLRRHRAFRGTGFRDTTGKEVGRTTLLFYPGKLMEGFAEPTRFSSKAWQRLHRKYILSWLDPNVKAQLLAILDEA